jgi:hypothetical protein
MAKTTWREFGANQKITLGHCFLFKKKQKENYRLLIGVGGLEPFQ